MADKYKAVVFNGRYELQAQANSVLVYEQSFNSHWVFDEDGIRDICPLCQNDTKYKKQREYTDGEN